MNYFKISLQEKSPAVAKLWHPSKNGSLKPCDIGYTSTKTVWWKCPKGHEYQAIVSNKRDSCPYCSGKRVSPENTLAAKFPAVAKEWHPRNNRPLKPSEITAKSGKKVWWQCRKGHEWQTTIAQRTAKGIGCPFCGNRNNKIPPESSLATKSPKVASEWHPFKNGDLKPSGVAPHAIYYAWWQCSKGHEWQARVYARTVGNGCPYCSGRLATPETCLQTINPDLASEWHPFRNRGLSPKDVLPMSNKKVWWQCSLAGHVWFSYIHQRSKGSGCPQCRKRRGWQEK